MIALHRTSLKEAIRWLPGIVISLVSIFLLLRLADLGQVIQALRTVKLSWLILAVLFYFLGIILRAWTWAILLQGQATSSRAFIALNEGYLLNNLFPFRLGEIGRALLLSRAVGISAFFVLSTIIIERAYDLAIASGLLLATLPFILGFNSAREASLLVLSFVSAALICLFFLARYHEAIKIRLENIWPSNLLYHERFLPRIGFLLSGLGILRRPDRFVISLLLILASWFFGSLEIHLLAVGFGMEPAWWWTGFVLGVVSLGIALPAAPANLGVYEAAMVGSFLLLGVPGTQALALAIIAHFIHITITGVIGVLALAREGQTLTGIYLQLRQEARWQRRP